MLDDYPGRSGSFYRVSLLNIMHLCLPAGNLPQLVRCNWNGGLPRLVHVPDQAPGDALVTRANAHAARRPCDMALELQGDPALGSAGLGGTDRGEVGVRISREEAARLRADAGAKPGLAPAARSSAAVARASLGSAARGDALESAAMRLLPVLEDRRAPEWRSAFLHEPSAAGSKSVKCKC